MEKMVDLTMSWAVRRGEAAVLTLNLVFQTRSEVCLMAIPAFQTENWVWPRKLSLLP
jgi:hypothetical protein